METESFSTQLRPCISTITSTTNNEDQIQLHGDGTRFLSLSTQYNTNVTLILRFFYHIFLVVEKVDESSKHMFKHLITVQTRVYYRIWNRFYDTQFGF